MFAPTLRRDQTEAEALKERAGLIATIIARSPDKRDEHGSLIDWPSITVDAFGETVSYHEAADRAQELATFGCERQALAILRRRYDALTDYLETSPVVLAMAEDELRREVVASYERDFV